MLIVCPSCAASYRVETACFAEQGRLVRCVRCGDVWLGNESLLLPAIIAGNEGGESDGSALRCGSVPEDLASPQSTPEPEGPEHAVPPFAAPADTTEPDHDGTVDHSVEMTREGFEPPSAAAALARPVQWGPSPLPRQFEATPALSQVYVLRKPNRRSVQRSGRGALCLSIAVLALVALHGAFIGWRRAVVKIVPQTASLYRAIGLPVNLRGLSIADVTTVAQLHEGVPLLLVEGTLANTSTRTVKVPRLRLALRNSAGQELYHWTQEPDRRSLSPGESLTFRARLALPPPEAHDVVVRFFNRDDTAGMQQTAAMKASRRGEPQ